MQRFGRCHMSCANQRLHELRLTCSKIGHSLWPPPGHPGENIVSHQDAFVRLFFPVARFIREIRVQYTLSRLWMSSMRKRRWVLVQARIAHNLLKSGKNSPSLVYKLRRSSRNTAQDPVRRSLGAVPRGEASPWQRKQFRGDLAPAHRP